MSAIRDPSEVGDRFAHNSANVEDWRVNPGDWIALCRRVEFHPVVGYGCNVKPADPRRGSYNRGEAWNSLLFLAAFKPGQVNNRGQVMSLDVGQLIGARAFLAERWNWTEKAVRVFLETLQREGMITVGAGQSDSESKGQSNRGGKYQPASVITISNYTRFQLLENELDKFVAGLKGPVRGQLTDDFGASDGAGDRADKRASEQSSKPKKKQATTLLPPVSGASVAASTRANAGASDFAVEGPENTISNSKKEEGTSLAASSFKTETVELVERGVRGESVQSSALSSVDQEGATAPAAKSKRGTRLPETWFLPKAWGEWARENFRITDDQIRREAESFKDYWLSRTGQIAVKADWFATWRNWIRKGFGKLERPKAASTAIEPSPPKFDAAKHFRAQMEAEGADFRPGEE